MVKELNRERVGSCVDSVGILSLLKVDVADGLSSSLRSG
jgi:hypothetical protein